MTAVDPARLAREIDRMLEQAPDPVARARGAVDLLERYAERSRKKSMSPEDALCAPRPVTAALARALASEASSQAEALALASALWSFPLRETRLLAADVLATWDGAEVAEWVEARSADTADLRLLEGLARTGLAAWKDGDRARALSRAGAWLAAPKSQLRELGLLLLLSMAEEGRSDDLRLVINLLAASPEVGLGPERKILVRLLISLARQTPRETARLLLDGVRRGNRAILQVARHALPALPPRQRQILEEALARAEPSGIIRTLSD